MNKNKQGLLLLVTFLVVSVNIGFSQTQQKKEKDFEIVGFHLDLRIQVMKPKALRELVDELAYFGVNTLIMEWEGTFPFQTNPVIANKYAYTKEEIKDFIAYCGQKNIEVIPLQQSLGHLEYVLRNYRYAEQREDQKDVSQVCPMEFALNKKLFTELITEMAEIHPSKYFHIGGDEAYLLGHCDKCKEKIAKSGKAALLADHLKMITDIVVSLGKIPVIWSDIATSYPGELNKLPKETIFIVWNYGWDVDRFGIVNELTKKGFEVWGSPALRSNPDNYFLTDWKNHFDNIKDFIPFCRESNYNGVVMTSWSTSGIYSPVFEDHHTITDLVPVRRVYPLSGFRILLAAYSQSMQQTAPLNAKRFIVSYAEKRFGFNKRESREFYRALLGSPYQVINGEVENHSELTVPMLYDSVKGYQMVFNKLRPERNQKEFEHIRLMKDIRENYMHFKKVEGRVNSDSFTKAMFPQVISELAEIIKKYDSLGQRYTNLNSGYLYPEAIDEENYTRTVPVKILYERLKGQKK
ncbi:beta-N-acetylhexosaminidase [Galbibacter sp. PAP.153]